MSDVLTREQLVTIKSLAHQLVLQWAGSRMLMGLTQQNGDVMRQDIVRSVEAFTLACDAALRQRVQELTTQLDASQKANAQLLTCGEHNCKPYNDLTADLAAMEQHLEAQRTATYQAISREHAAKKQVVEVMHERDALRLRLQVVEAALTASTEALTAWLHQYAPDL
jgi:hypothetical protein